MKRIPQPLPLRTHLILYCWRYEADASADAPHACYGRTSFYTAGVMKLMPLRTHLMFAHALTALTKSLPDPALSKHREIMSRFTIGQMPFFARKLILIAFNHTRQVELLHKSGTATNDPTGEHSKTLKTQPSPVSVSCVDVRFL
jgi:hypothetical protein